MTVYQKLKQIEADFNTYKIEADEAVAKAKPLIESFNENSLTKAASTYSKPTRLSLRHFAFGR